MRDRPNSGAEAPFRGVNAGKFFLGVLILLVGLSYFGESLGLLSFNVGYVLQHIWSILLIFIGLSMLSRSSRFWTWFGIGVSAAVLFMLFYAAADDSAWGGLRRLERVEVARSADASRARIRIDSQAAALRVDGGGGKLLSGTFQSPFLSLRTKSETEAGVQTVSLDTRDASGQSGWQYLGRNIGSFDLHLQPDVPVDLEVNSAASDINLNLGRIPARHIRIWSGASNMALSLGDRLSTSTVEIESKASAVTLRVPRSVGVRIKLASNISSKSLPDFYPQGDGIYESENYARSDIKTDVYVNSAIASLGVEWEE